MHSQEEYTTLEGEDYEGIRRREGEERAAYLDPSNLEQRQKDFAELISGLDRTKKIRLLLDDVEDDPVVFS